MSRGEAPLADRRVAVITTALASGTNELWEAARHHVAALEVVGGRSKTDPPPGPGEVALRSVDAGRGLIWRHLVGLRRYLRSFRPDLVHVNGELWGVTAQESLRWGVPVVVHGAENLWEHGGTLERRARRRLVSRAIDGIAGYASWNHAGADHVQRLASISGRDLPTLVLPAIIPPSPFRAVRWSQPPLGADSQLEVLLVGRAVASKGFQVVIEAAAQVRDISINLTLCGDGPELSALKSLASARGVRLVCRGQVTDEELASTMTGSHVQVQPSLTTPDWSEQFGRSVAEAMSVGLPCLVSDSGELPEVVGHGSAVVPEGDSRVLAQRLQQLIDKPDLLGALSEQQRARSTRYSPDEASRRLVQFWTDSYS